MIIGNEYIKLEDVTWAVLDQVDGKARIALHMRGYHPHGPVLTYLGQDAERVWAALKDLSANFFATLEA